MEASYLSASRVSLMTQIRMPTGKPLRAIVMPAMVEIGSVLKTALACAMAWCKMNIILKSSVLWVSYR